MDHSPVEPTAKGPTSTSTGDVFITPIAGPRDTSQLTAALVRCTHGARSHRHSHDVGQTLHDALAGARDRRAVPRGARGRPMIEQAHRTDGGCRSIGDAAQEVVAA